MALSFSRVTDTHTHAHNTVCESAAHVELEGVARGIGLIMLAFFSLQRWLSLVAKSDYYTLTRFLFPLSFTVIAVDIGEQFLNRSLARSADVVDVLAAFGLGFSIVKVFNGVLGEIKHAGLVLVHDRPAYRRILVFTIAAGSIVTIFLIILAATELGVWLFRDLHGVSETVSDLTRSALLYTCAYPLFEALSWYHAGLLLQVHASTLVGAASLADIIAQIFLIAVLLYTPIVCRAPIVLPILAAYGGVVTRCSILLIGFYRRVHPKMNGNTTMKLSVLRIVVFLAPLMFTLFIQRISRPLINLIIARSSPSKEKAAQEVAVLTASYPLGHLPYGWLNTLKPVPPAFQQKRTGSNRPCIGGKKIAVFCIACLGVSAVVSFVLGWIPGVSVAVLVNVVAIPRHLAQLCVTPLRIFSFFCFTVSIRASLTGWLIVHRQTKLVAPSGFLRLAAIISSLFILPQLGVTGADNGVASLFSGFFIEMVSVVGATACFACYKRCRSERRGHASVLSGGSQEQEMLTVELEQTDDRGDTVENNALSTEEIRTSEVVQRTPQENIEQTSVL